MSYPLQLVPNYILSMLDPQSLCNRHIPCKNTISYDECFLPDPVNPSFRILYKNLSC